MFASAGVFYSCVCLHVSAYRRMSEVNAAVLEVPVRERVAFLQEFSIHA